MNKEVAGTNGDKTGISGNSIVPPALKNSIIGTNAIKKAEKADTSLSISKIMEPE